MANYSLVFGFGMCFYGNTFSANKPALKVHIPISICLQEIHLHVFSSVTVIEQKWAKLEYLFSLFFNDFSLFLVLARFILLSFLLFYYLARNIIWT